jgi:hypothetical protein
MPDFLPGLELSRALYEDAVAPLLEREYPDLRYAAARIGSGSEVLGFDTIRSADHEWGPRLQLFIDEADAGRLGPAIGELLREQLPAFVRGWPTNFRESDDPLDPVGRMEASTGPVNHRVSVTTVPLWMGQHLGVRADRPPTALEWLGMPQQRLAEVVGGAVFRDDQGHLTRARSLLAWYPEQVWRYQLACQWQRIAQEEAFAGRAAEVGDELGARLVTSRLVRDVIRLALLLGRRYAPYTKWLGSAFSQLPSAPRLLPHVQAALQASEHAARERALAGALETAGRLQNEVGLADPVDPTPRSYHGRPYLVLHAERFAEALRETVTDPVLERLPLTGGVDQWADSTDFLHRRPAIRAALDALTHQAHESPPV